MEFRPLHKIPVNVVVSLWNSNLGESFPMREALWEQNTSHEINLLQDASLGAFQKDELVGFVAAKLLKDPLSAEMNSTIAWIQALLVDKHHRNEMIGSELLLYAEAELKKKDINEIQLGRDVYHYFPGVPANDKNTISWFEHKGYQQETIVTDLTKNVFNQSLYKLHNEKNEQLEFRVLTENDLISLLAFLKTVFPGRWHYEAEAYVQATGNGRDFIGLFKDGQLKGFCRINDGKFSIIPQNIYWSPLLKGSLGGIGPLGISPEIRGQQVGLDLVKSAANELMKRKMDHIVIDWTELVPFYEKLGFKPWKKYVTMSKKLYTSRINRLERGDFQIN
ncbi:GNAT family N-acetyltransferase [Jeotgalibacillus soli]|uniref:N-acetyltransferase domain-containing protein n=1 Tax=Jeotgalibacillus soli TaxID=889306 RepID=A0A0C2RHB2_9BACL|nr:GNAT family N-acetyltransferase [Jeotgalibacillus soli]KIL49540.1 hypothetical protein KP78_10080 [Jeotgalibacillus soli]